MDLDRPELPAPSGGPHILGPVPAVRDLVDRLGILRPLRIRDFALMWTGMTVSMIGDGVYLIAVAWQAPVHPVGEHAAREQQHDLRQAPREPDHREQRG